MVVREVAVELAAWQSTWLLYFRPYRIWMGHFASHPLSLSASRALTQENVAQHALPGSGPA